MNGVHSTTFENRKHSVSAPMPSPQLVDMYTTRLIFKCVHAICYSLMMLLLTKVLAEYWYMTENWYLYPIIIHNKVISVLSFRSVPTANFMILLYRLMRNTYKKKLYTYIQKIPIVCMLCFPQFSFVVIFKRFYRSVFWVASL